MLNDIMDTPCGATVAQGLERYYVSRGFVTDTHQTRIWGILTELYLAYCLTGIDLQLIRNFQYAVQEEMRPTDISCKDYDQLCKLVFCNGNQLPLIFPDGTFNKIEIDASLLKEAIDFLRDGQ
ncbi:MAG: hypothetical protein MJY79_07985 [Bacteroidaceae bacterium]|nr:hypothetical protein [Bacteroidaceae bacterium]